MNRTDIKYLNIRKRLPSLVKVEQYIVRCQEHSVAAAAQHVYRASKVRLRFGEDGTDAYPLPPLPLLNPTIKPECNTRRSYIYMQILSRKQKDWRIRHNSEVPPSWWEVSPFHFHWYSLDVTHTRNSHTWKGLPEPRQKRIPLLSLGVWEKQPPLVKAAGTGVLREGDLPLRSGAVIPRGWGSPHQLGFFLHLPTSCPQVWLHEWEVHNTVE